MSADAAVKLVVSVTQDPAEYIGVVQIQQKENTETVMETLGPVNLPAAPEPMFSLTLHREFLFSQDSPILDVMLDNDGKHAEALGTQEIRSYEMNGDQWVPTEPVHVPIQRPAERGERGFIFHGIDSEEVYLSGQLCRISLLDAKGWELREIYGTYARADGFPRNAGRKEIGRRGFRRPSLRRKGKRGLS